MGCDLVSPLGATIIGLLAGIILVFSIEFIDTKLHIDDPVGASSVHRLLPVPYMAYAAFSAL